VTLAPNIGLRLVGWLVGV